MLETFPPQRGSHAKEISMTMVIDKLEKDHHLLDIFVQDLIRCGIAVGKTRFVHLLSFFSYILHLKHFHFCYINLSTCL